MTDRIGQPLGNYRLIRLLGRGGFAEVYLGEHVYLKTPAAIKVLQTKITHQEDFAGFLKEAQTIAQLIHPHIVRVLEFGLEEETPFLVMDFAAGGSLRQRHPKGTQLPLITIITYAKQVAEALQYAHEEKYIHRDIKPENMLMGRLDTVLLSDFGIALIAQSSRYQHTQDVIGTVAYMSPEQIQGKPRPASDQYSLGIVIYEWLSGHCPFHGSFTELCTQHIMAPPPSLREKMPEISQGIEQVVMTALAKDPQQRFRNIQTFAAALEQANTPKQYHLISSQSQPPEPIVVTTRSYQYVWPSTPTLSSSQPSSQRGMSPLSIDTQSAKQGISRRSVIGGLAVVGTAAGMTLLALSHAFSGSPSTLISTITKLNSNFSPLAPTVTPIPLGMLLYTYPGHSSYVNAVAWSPDSRRIASGAWDQTVQVWNAADGGNLFIYRGHSTILKTLAWSPNGTRIISGSDDGGAHVWDAVDGGHLYMYRGHSKGVWSVVWSPNSQRIASGSADMTVQVWDAADGGNLYMYRGHSSYVNAVAWSPDGHRIASGSGDGTVQVWDAADGGNHYVYRGHSGAVWWVTWSPDGRRIASGSMDKTVQVWQAS